MASSDTSVTWKGRATLISTGCLAGLVLLEIVLHLVLGEPYFRFPVARITDDRLNQRKGRTIEANGVHYTYDQDGFRVDGTQRSDWKRTVLFLGDSFTEGFGVEAGESFPAVTCSSLQERGLQVRCVNAGVTGFGTSHELRLLRRLLERPDLVADSVVFQILPNNDFRDDWEDGGFRVEGSELKINDPPRIPIEVRLRDLLLNNSLARASHVITLAANAWFFDPGKPLEDGEASFQLERALLTEVVSTARRRGIAIVVVLSTTSWEFSRQSTHRYDEIGRLEWVAETLRELDVPWIDSRLLVRENDHYNGDGHLSVLGNRVLGERVAQTIEPLLTRLP